MAKIYRLENSYYNQIKTKLQAPKFQRNFIWKTKAKKELINSLKRGLPIGCIILQDRKDGFYNIIDGRQRLSTLADFEKHRSRYLDQSDITIEEIDRLFTSVPAIGVLYNNPEICEKGSIYTSFPKAVQNLLKKYENSQALFCEKLRDSVLSVFPDESFDSYKKNKKGQQALDSIKDDLLKSVEVFYNNICSIVNLNALVLPCIIFELDAEPNDIIESFENINTKGTKLSRYDLYAASWESKIIYVDDKEILDKVISKYKDSIEINQNIMTEGVNEYEILQSKLINIFEYSYAISKIVGDYCGHMYETKDPSEVDSLGFTILAGIFNVKTAGDMVCLADKLVDSKLDYGNLKDKIVLCAEGVRDVLKAYCVPYKDANFYDHSVNQLVRYIVTEFKCLYTIDTANSKILNNPKSSSIKIFHRYLPKHYLFDNISGFWSGTGDKKLDNLVITEGRNGYVSDITDNRYFKDIDKERFEQALLHWITDSSDGLNYDSNAKTRPSSKLFISFLICKNGGRVTSSQLDIEHIIPQAALDKLKDAPGSTLTGISSPANLTLLPMSDNRSKKDQTYYQWQDDLKDKNSAGILDKEVLEKYLYPKHDDIRFVETDSFSIAAFDNFKANRAKQLIEKFSELFYAD